MNKSPTHQINLLSREDAIQVLAPYLEEIQEVHYWAMHKLLAAIQPDIELGLALQPSAKASMLNDLIWHRAQERFLGDPSLRFLVVSKPGSRGFKALYIHDKLLVRFKKLDEGGRAKNYRTPHQEEYDSQLPMDEVPQATRIVVGYVLDEFHTGFAKIQITCPLNDGFLWQEVVSEGSAEQTNIEFSPVPEVEEPIVKVKKPAQPLLAREQ